jgi:16S rRNA (guanine527-N7)-methyltransferase
MNDRDEFLNSVDVSRETAERLDIFAALLAKWNPSINLVGKSTLPTLWARHFLDSAQIFELAPEAKRWADLGAGGGFPGLIVAILAAERQPGLRVTCVESDKRKATFLRSVVREAGISADIVADRIEAVPPLGAQVVSARALAPLAGLLALGTRHLAPGGTAIFPKGAAWKDEVAEALESWAFRLDTYPSKTDSDATILNLGDIRRV